MKINKRLLFPAVAVLLFVLTDVSAQWMKSPRFHGVYINCFAVYGGNIFAGTDRGVFLSINNGTSWDSVSNGLTNTNIRALATDGTNFYTGTWGDGIFLSTNNGTSWISASTNLNNYSIHTIAINGSSVFDGTENGICRSTDNGSHWYTATNGLTNGSVQVIIVRGTDILAGTGGGGVFRSTDDGVRWDSASIGLPVGSTIYTFAYEGVNLFAGAYGGGVFLSANRQVSWDPVNTGLTNKYVNSLAVKGTNVFAGTSYGGVFLSTNNGGNWNTINTGLIDTNILSMAVSDNYLFAGTDNGLWRRPLSEIITGVEDNSVEMPSGFSLDQNYPNPFNPETTIKFSVGRRSNVSLRIYDVLGREVATLVSGEIAAGSYTRQWNAEKITSGIYYYRLSVVPLTQRDLVPVDSRDGQAGISMQTKKMILLK